jgi:glycosyltransferase involved in cell wall biosynthesis
MITVCHIISGDLWAGVEVMVFNLLKYLNKFNNMKIFTIILNEGRLAQEIRNLGIPVYILNENTSSFMTILNKIIKIIKIINPDIMHSHRYKENIFSYFAAKGSNLNNNIKLISTQHGMPLLKEKIDINRSIWNRNIISSNGIDEPLARWGMLKYNYHILSRSFNYTVAVSKDIKKLLIQTARFSEKRTIVIYNGIDIPLHYEPEMNNKYFYIGSAGRLFSIKDFPLFIETARILRDDHRDVQFMLAGDGPEREKLQNLVNKYELGKNFRFLGFINKTSDFYKELDLYMNTSFHEGIPMSILEALSYGKPVVAPAVGGLSEIIEDGVEGFLVDSRDPFEYAKKCITLMTDKTLREKMSNAGIEKINNKFSVLKMVESYTKLYCDMVKKM